VEKITSLEIPGNSRRELEDARFPGIPEREFPVALIQYQRVTDRRTDGRPAYIYARKNSSIRASLSKPEAICLILCKNKIILIMLWYHNKY